MNDLVTRLRNWRNVHLARLHLLMEEAATEIERLSQYGDCPDRDNAANRDNTPATHDTPSEGREQGGCTLAAEEREAIAYFASFHESPRESDANAAATLRGLLKRLPEPEAVLLLKAEVRRLRAAITALADQAATLSVCEGNVTVTMDGTLTDEEREAVAVAMHRCDGPEFRTLRGLLERF